VKITRLRINSYRGIEELDAEIPPAGMIVKGRNGKAKTSVLRAIRAGLEGADISPNAIRIGAERAEILIDTDDVSVQRVITPAGSKVAVERDIAGVRAKVPSPAKYLKDLMGLSSIDPLDLLSAKTAEDRRARRARVLAAVPAHVTAEQIAAWTGEPVRGAVDPNTHGLEVIAQLRTAYYDRRTEANAKAKDARRKANELADEVSKLPERPEDTESLEEAREAKESAARALALLEAKAKAAADADQRTQAARARIEDLRKRADGELVGMSAPSQDDMRRALARATQWADRVRELEKELEEARSGQAQADLYLKSLETRIEQVNSAQRRADDMRRQASDIESAISAASVEAPSAEEIARARVLRSTTIDREFEAIKLEEQDAVRRRAFDAEQSAKALEADADRLDRIVQTLTKDAPADLLASANGIPGLQVDGDQIFIDGVDFDGLCGREQLRFAVEIAKRANSRAKILIVDGLERIGEEDLEEFVRLATADDWQLFATRVTSGERVIEAIQIDGGVS
jgi:hypothetical protein